MNPNQLAEMYCNVLAEQGIDPDVYAQQDPDGFDNDLAAFTDGVLGELDKQAAAEEAEIEHAREIGRQMFYGFAEESEKQADSVPGPELPMRTNGKQRSAWAKRPTQHSRVGATERMRTRLNAAHGPKFGPYGNPNSTALTTTRRHAGQGDAGRKISLGKDTGTYNPSKVRSGLNRARALANHEFGTVAGHTIKAKHLAGAAGAGALAYGAKKLYDRSKSQSDFLDPNDPVDARAIEMLAEARLADLGYFDEEYENEYENE